MGTLIDVLLYIAEGMLGFAALLVIPLAIVMIDEKLRGKPVKSDLAVLLENELLDKVIERTNR